MSAGAGRSGARRRVVLVVNAAVAIVLASLLWQRLLPRVATDVRRDLLLDAARVELLEGFDGVDRLVPWNDEKRTNPDRPEVALPVRRPSRLLWRVEARPGLFRARVARLQASADADASACELVVTARDADGAAGPSVVVPVPACPAGAAPPAQVLWREGPASDVALALPHGAASLEIEVRSPGPAPELAWVALLSPRVEQAPQAVPTPELKDLVPVAEHLLPRLLAPGVAEPVVFAVRQRLGADGAPLGEPDEVRLPPVEAVGGFVARGGAGADERPALALVGEAVCTWTVDVPEGAVFRTACALDERLPPGASAEVVLRVDGAELARTRVEASRWTAWSVPLAGRAGAGRTLDLALEAPVLEPLEVDYLEPDYDLGDFVPSRVTAQRVRVGVADPVVERVVEVARRTTARERPSVLLIQVETLRADVLPFHGGLPEGWPELAPHMAELSARGVTWEAAMTPSSWTLPTSVSLLTGLMPSAHGAVDHRHTLMPGDAPTLAERARRAGVATGAVVASDILRPHAGFDRGFESFAHVPYANARQVNDLVGAFLENHLGQQFLLFVHAFDPHGPYNAPGAWRDRYVEPGLRGLTIEGAEARWRDAMLAGKPPSSDDPDLRFLRQRYLGEIAWFDHQLGELMAGLERLGLDESTIVVLTSDHGEEFMEHGLYGHGSNLHDETLHVPLVVAPPEDLRLRWPRGGRVPGVASTVSVHASVLSWLGVPFDGSSVWAPLEQPSDFAFSETSKGLAPASGKDRLRRYLASTRTADERVIYAAPVDDEPAGGTWTLYDLATDPAALQPAETVSDPSGSALHGHGRLMKDVLDWCEAHRLSAPLEGGGAQTLETLRAFGYTGER